MLIGSSVVRPAKKELFMTAERFQTYSLSDPAVLQRCFLSCDGAFYVQLWKVQIKPHLREVTLTQTFIILMCRLHILVCIRAKELNVQVVSTCILIPDIVLLWLQYRPVRKEHNPDLLPNKSQRCQYWLTFNFPPKRIKVLLLSKT